MHPIFCPTSKIYNVEWNVGCICVVLKFLHFGGRGGGGKSAKMAITLVGMLSEDQKISVVKDI